MNRKAFDRINYGLFVIGAAQEGRLQGCIVMKEQVQAYRQPYQDLLSK